MRLQTQKTTYTNSQTRGLSLLLQWSQSGRSLILVKNLSKLQVFKFTNYKLTIAKSLMDLLADHSGTFVIAESGPRNGFVRGSNQGHIDD